MLEDLAGLDEEGDRALGPIDDGGEGLGPAQRGAVLSAGGARVAAAGERGDGDGGGHDGRVPSPRARGHDGLALAGGEPGKRQAMDRAAAERQPGIGDRRRDGRHAGLADPRGRRRRRHDVHLDARHLVDAQDPEVVEVGLLHAPVDHGDLAPERRAEAEADAALHLRAHDVGVHRDAAVHRADDALDPGEAIAVARHLGHLGHDAPEHSCRATPRARPGGSGWPHPAWRAARSSTPR